MAEDSAPLLDLARLAELEAGYAVLAALLLMARIPALDRRVGSDHLALLHAWVGRWIVGLAPWPGGPAHGWRRGWA